MAFAAREIGLFVRRWLANPLRVGAIAPSSRSLGRLVARHAVSSADDVVVELGAGTGTITRELINAGAREDNLVLVELDADLAAYLRRWFPRATIVQDDASRPAEIVPDWVCEMLSPATASKDREIKLPVYAGHGVGYAWLVDPRAQRVEAYANRDGTWETVATIEGADAIVAPPFDAVAIAPPWA